MVIKTASPGVLVNEIDLTRGTSDAITTNIGALCGPFLRGPVDQIVKINTEAELEQKFGRPTDENAEYWWTVSNFLEYGGVCYVVRCDDAMGDDIMQELGLEDSGLQTMRNAVDVLDQYDESIYVKNIDHFTEDIEGQNVHPARFISRNPGEWGNNIGISIIDSGADFQNVLRDTNIREGTSNDVVPDETVFAQFLDGGVNVGTYISVRAGGGLIEDFIDPDTTYPVYVEAFEDEGTALLDGKGYVMSYKDGIFRILVTAGNFQEGDILTKGFVGVGFASATIAEVYPIGNHITYKPDLVEASLLAETGDNLFTDESNPNFDFDLLAETVVPGGFNNDRVVDTIWRPQEYTLLEGTNLFAWPRNPRNNQKARVMGAASHDVYLYNARREMWVNQFKPGENDLLYDGDNVFQIQIASDWYTNQVAFQGIPWFRFADRPGTSLDAQDRNAQNDEMNVIVYDATGDLTGSKGNVLETYLGISKLSGAKTPEGEINYYLDRINEFSNFIYAHRLLEGSNSGLNDGLTSIGQPLRHDVYCEYVMPGQRTLVGGVNNLSATLGEIQAAYNKFDVEAVFDLDYLLQGPAGDNMDNAVAKANFIISIAEERRDCMAFLSPPRYLVVSQEDSLRKTHNVVAWAKELTSSSYAVFDSGYKYHYDRFTDRYRHTPLNGDIAGTVVNTAFRSEPWYSPAGFQRGQIRNAVRLSFNPSRKMRDDLYSNRVNPVVDFPGEGTILYGDKTALAYSSAFDRINVRRLFLIIEKEIAKISKTTLFEFNDPITRTLFKNNVNPFMRTVQSGRGCIDFLVVCDESNNPPEIIDRNEFIADIYVKPNRSINFITLNFVATKTGVSFGEAVGLFRRNQF